MSRFLFSALALAVVLALFASYFVAMTVVPLFCARFITIEPGRTRRSGTGDGLAASFNGGFNRRLRTDARRLYAAPSTGR